VDEDLKIQVIVRRGKEIHKKIFKHYLARNVPLSRFFDDFVAEIDALIKEIVRR